MIIHWDEVCHVPNDIGEPDGRPCECGRKVPHEHLEMFKVSDGAQLIVKKVQTSGNAVRIWVDV